MPSRHSSEAGHVQLGMAFFLTGVALLILALAIVQTNPTLAWIGGLGGAVFLLLQFLILHQEIGRLWQHIERLEGRRRSDNR